MKKLLLISALLIFGSNVWADRYVCKRLSFQFNNEQCKEGDVIEVEPFDAVSYCDSSKPIISMGGILYSCIYNGKKYEKVINVCIGNSAPKQRCINRETGEYSKDRMKPKEKGNSK